MALNDVSFQLGQGGLGRPLPGEDYISGIIFCNSSLPTGFQGTGNNIQQVFQTSDAEALGITNTYSDEVQATGTITVSGTITAGNTITVQVIEPSPSGGTTTITLGTYSITGTDTTGTVATNLAAVINANSAATGGYVALANPSASPNPTVTITARKGLGAWLKTGSNLSATKSS